MGERHDLPKIKPDEKPSIINHGAADGAGWGALIGTFAGVAAFARKGGVFLEQAVVQKKGAALGVAGAILGAILGGVSDKSKLENELTAGRVVKSPDYVNKGILSGLGIGIAYNVTNTALGKPGSTLIPSKFSPLVGLGAMITGSIMRKNSLQRDFDKAVAIRDAHTAQAQQMLAASIAQQQVPAAPTMDEPPSFKNSVTPDEAALLMEKQAQAAGPVTPKPEHGPEHKPHTDHTAHGDAHAPEHHAAHGEHHSEHQDEHHDAPSHAAKHEHQQHTGSHAAKHEPAASHTDHAEKHDAGMAMSA